MTCYLVNAILDSVWYIFVENFGSVYIDDTSFGLSFLVMSFYGFVSDQLLFYRLRIIPFF